MIFCVSMLQSVTQATMASTAQSRVLGTVPTMNVTPAQESASLVWWATRDSFVTLVRHFDIETIFLPSILFLRFTAHFSLFDVIYYFKFYLDFI